MRKFCRNMAHPGYMNFGLKVFSASEKRERWMLKNDCPVDSKPWYLMTICLQTELQIIHWKVKLIQCHVWFSKSNLYDWLFFLIWDHVYGWQSQVHSAFSYLERDIPRRVSNKLRWVIQIPVGTQWRTRPSLPGSPGSRLCKTLPWAGHWTRR